MSNVSVILPVYNEEKLVSKAIESVPKDVELIVINDGSTDNTLRVLKKYDNIKLISYANNKGVAHALNRGLDKATGDYIVLLSADDYFYTHNFILATQMLDGTDIIFFQATTNYGLIDLDIGNTRAGSFKFVRREFLGNLRNEEQRLAGEDYNLWQKILAKKPSIKYLDLIVKHYNYPREGSLNWQLNKGLIDLESGQKMTIVLTCNKKWYQYITTLIYSINYHNDCKIYLIIEDDKLPYEIPSNVEIININKLPHFINKSSPNIDTHYTRFTFVRCYLSKILKEDKILYLDADTIVNNSLLDLWQTDITDYAIAGVKEYGEWFDYIGVPNDEYINAGVLLMNLKYIREHKIDDQLLKLINSKWLGFPDQDAINIVCNGKIKYINPVYNSQELTLITANAIIIHYIRSRKGWFKDSPRSIYWQRYREKMLTEKLKGGYEMIRAEVIERFNFARFNELKNINRKYENAQEGLLEVGDQFDCSKEIADYLLGDNALKRAFIEIIEVIPEKEEPKIEKEEKPAKKVAKKTTKKAKK